MERQTFLMEYKAQHSKDVISPKINIQINAIPVKIPAIFFVETEKSTLKFMWKERNSAKTILKENERKRITLFSFKSYSTVTVINSAWCGWRVDTQMEGTEKLEKALRKYSQLIFDRSAKAIHWRKDCLFSKQRWNN